MTCNQYLTNILLKWHLKDNIRKMPWKGEKDPYKIWLSEIILQQTRVAQGLSYYHSFLKSFPHIHDLAQAPEQIVYKHWEGLGYYSRCKNLIKTARYISEKLDGKFPDTYDELLKLYGVGPYTAAAIASFAFELPHAVIDGNVFRVLSRFYGVQEPIDTNSGKKIFSKIAGKQLSKIHPALYNQAIMDFGAEICKPKKPLCDKCPANSKCIAFNTHLVNVLPVKQKTIKQKNRWLYYIVINYKKRIYIKKRLGKDIWQNLHEFVLIESVLPLEKDELLFHPKLIEALKSVKFTAADISKIYKQKLTHQQIFAQFLEVKITGELKDKSYTLVDGYGMDKLAFPKIISTYLQDKNVSLNLLKVNGKS
ncbi:A/G-specific adenine glycosylase [soil metagenome]